MRIDPQAWTAIIPAAGRGTRLGYDRPKILYPVAGRPILNWLLDLFDPQCSRIVFVLSPEGAPDVREALSPARLGEGRYQIAIQHTPTGMGDAVSIGLERVTTENVAVVWGDQVALRPESVAECLRIHSEANADVTVPTVHRPNPYIHFERDGEGRIVRLLQAREGDTMPAEGESDTGFFCFRTASLRKLLEDLRSNKDTGRSTGEFNLLPVIPLAARQGAAVLTPHVMELEETVGVNSAADAAVVEQYLEKVHGYR